MAAWARSATTAAAATTEAINGADVPVPAGSLGGLGAITGQGRGALGALRRAERETRGSERRPTCRRWGWGWGERVIFRPNIDLCA